MDWYGDFEMVRNKLKEKGYHTTKVTGRMSGLIIEIWMKSDEQGIPTSIIIVSMDVGQLPHRQAVWLVAGPEHLQSSLL